MKVKSKSKIQNISVCRTNKASIPMISDKRMYYYLDHRETDDNSKEIFYVLIDNTKGKKETYEFSSLNELEKFIKK